MTSTRKASTPQRHSNASPRPGGLATPLVRARTIALALACAAGLAGCGILFHRDLPHDLAGLPETFSARGGSGLAQLRRLHGVTVGVQSGAFAIYGGGAVTVWVAAARDTAAAQRLIREMTTRIGADDSPFRVDSTRAFDGRDVEMLHGLGQRHFVFRSGKRVVWLASAPRESGRALEEALRFYR